MPTYYNKMRMGLSLPLLRGGSVLVSAKGTITIPAEEDGAFALKQLVARGYVIRTDKDVAPSVTVVAPVATPVLATNPVVVASTVVSSETSQEPVAVQSASSLPDDLSFRGKKRRG
jgi:hypothetical protein